MTYPADTGKSTEDECREYLLSLGYEIIKPGWPDFLCVKDNHIMAVEAKTNGSPVKKHQRETIKILEKFGMNVFIYRNGKLKDIKGRYWDLVLIPPPK